MEVHLIDGSPLVVTYATGSKISNVRGQLEQDLNIGKLQEIKLFSGTFELLDPMPASDRQSH